MRMRKLSGVKMVQKPWFIVVVLLFFGLSNVNGQEDWGCDKPSKKALKSFKKAEQYNFNGDPAYQFLIDAVNEDENYAAALSILAYINSKKDQSSPQNKNRTISYYEKTNAACAAYRNYEAAWWLVKNYYAEKDYDKAQSYLTEYLAGADEKEGNQLKEAKNLQSKIDQYRIIFKNPVPFDPKVVEGPSTSSDEYLPMLSPDNQYLFFTRKIKEDSKTAVGASEKEMFIQSRKKYDGTFSTGIPMPPPFNKGAYQGGASISVDNRLMFITVVNQEPTKEGVLFSNGDIYFSEFKYGSWTDLKSVGPQINGRQTWEGQPSISADNKTLYFASARGEDNYGGMDLYKSKRQTDGSWGSPINLGPEINTAGDEKSPFMHSDSYTLYFSSDGLPGVGGQDIFYVKEDGEGNFSDPRNIGIPINTAEDEHGFMVSTDGRYGYFASNPKNKGLDIYYFKLPEAARPKKVVFVKGSIESKDTNAAKGMNIELKNMATNKVVEGVVNEESGDYVAVIAANESEDVMMMAKKDGYAFSSQYVKSDQEVVGKPLRLPKMEFNPIEVGETYSINNINFATDSYVLNPQVKNILNEFIDFLKKNDGIKLAINGHTDDVGDANANLTLSTERAKAVYDYLVQEGISATRLQYKGYGEKKPIVENATAEGRAKNRRTEFVILSQ